MYMVCVSNEGAVNVLFTDNTGRESRLPLESAQFKNLYKVTHLKHTQLKGEATMPKMFVK